MSTHLSPRVETAQTPLPKLQISIILLMRLAEPVSFSIIFPFISQMVEEELGVVKDKSQVGFYAGLIESVFSLAQALMILRWARLSDRIGRRPVILMGLCGVALSNLLFGFSKSLWFAIASRTIMGGLNGNIAVVSSLITEITDKSNRALAFSLYSGTWGIAFTLGSLLGGYLSRPVESFPSLFGPGSPFHLRGLFESYPYCLPCLTASFITSLSFILGSVFLKETHPSVLASKSRRLQRSNADDSSDIIHQSAEHSRSNLANESTPTREVRQSSASLLRNPYIRRIMLANGYLAVSQVCSDAALVLFLYTPIDLGGLGFSSQQIGVYLASIGVTSAGLQLIFFPIFQKRFGTKKILIVAMSGWVFQAAFLPICSCLARRDLIIDATGDSFDEIVSETAKSIIYVLRLSFACTAILVNESAKLLVSTASSTSSENLGALNGLAVTIGSVMRCIGPALTSSLFALSVSKQLMGGQLVWWLLIIVGGLGVENCLLIRDLEEEEATGELPSGGMNGAERRRSENERDEHTPLLSRSSST